MTKQPGVKPENPVQIRVRRIHRRDLNRTWEFLKLVFRDVNRETVEYQRPFSKRIFLEVYDQEGIEQLLFETDDGEIVGYSEVAFDTSADDNWINPRYFDKRGMRPLYVDELAVHPGYQGRGVGSFMLDQLQHLARVRGCTHLVLEVAENNESALSWYHKRNFYKLDAAIFLAQKVPAEPELLPPRKLPSRKRQAANAALEAAEAPKAAKAKPAASARKEPAKEKSAPKAPKAAKTPKEAAAPAASQPARPAARRRPARDERTPAAPGKQEASK
jgi:ribosomal protein S18 acetylase RimI-like enzyme